MIILENTASGCQCCRCVVVNKLRVERALRRQVGARTPRNLVGGQSRQGVNAQSLKPETQTAAAWG
eukprot:SAG11_NODE_13144_length_668_cov_0.731107_1_plen_65_part_10